MLDRKREKKKRKREKDISREKKIKQDQPWNETDVETSRKVFVTVLNAVKQNILMVNEMIGNLSRDTEVKAKKLEILWTEMYNSWITNCTEWT